MSRVAREAAWASSAAILVSLLRGRGVVLLPVIFPTAGYAMQVGTLIVHKPDLPDQSGDQLDRAFFRKCRQESELTGHLSPRTFVFSCHRQTSDHDMQVSSQMLAIASTQEISEVVLLSDYLLTEYMVHAVSPTAPQTRCVTFLQEHPIYSTGCLHTSDTFVIYFLRLWLCNGAPRISAHAQVNAHGFQADVALSDGSST